MTNATDVLNRLRAVLQELEVIAPDYCPLTQQLIKDMKSFIEAYDNEAPIEEVLEAHMDALVAAAYATKLLERAAEAHVKKGTLH